MNAPAVATAPATFQSLALTAICQSRTNSQQLRRKHCDVAKLQELTASIRAQGVLQPILVRPLPAQDGNPITHELVVGERRWLAAARAGLDRIDANVRDLTNAQVIEAQLVENTQREDAHPLEEAAAFEELLKDHLVNPHAIGALIGKSRAYVYARLKLLDLCPAARAALDSGEIDASKALLLARFKGEKLQQKALRLIENLGHHSYRSVLATVRDNFMKDLADAPFALDDAELTTLKNRQTVQWPACDGCPSYSRNDPELQADFDADARICVDRACYEQKVVAFHARRAAEIQQAGKIILVGDAAAAAIPDPYYGCNHEYVDLDARCDEMEFPEPEPEKTGDEKAASEAWDDRAAAWEPPTYRTLLAGARLDPVFAQDKKGVLHELAPVKDAAKALKAQGIKLTLPSRPEQRTIPEADTEAMKFEREKQEERQARELEFRRRLFAQIHAKWKGALKRDDLAAISEVLLQRIDTEPLAALYEKRLDPAKASEADLARLCIETLFCNCINDSGESPAPLITMARRLKIDPNKIKQAIVAEARAGKKEEQKWS